MGNPNFFSINNNNNTQSLDIAVEELYNILTIQPTPKPDEDPEDPDAYDPAYESIFAAAADIREILNQFKEQEQQQVIEKLIKKYPEICQFKNIQNITALHYFAASGNLIAIKALLESGADIMALTVENDTPLHALAININNENEFMSLVPVIQYLISQGADADHSNIHGQTPRSIIIDYVDGGIINLEDIFPELTSNSPK